MNKLVTASAVISTLILGMPVAMAQTKVDVVDAVLKEFELREWAAGAPDRFGHPTRPEEDTVLAQCMQDALASGDYPEIEAVFLANKAYVEATIPRALVYNSIPANDWNPQLSTFVTFQLMNKGEDADAQARSHERWLFGWGATFGDDTGAMDAGDVDFSAQSAVEAMYSACSTVSNKRRTDVPVEQTLPSLGDFVEKHREKIHITWEADILPGGLESMVSVAEQWKRVAAKDPNTLYSRWVITEDSTKVRLDTLFADGESAQAQFPVNLWPRLDVLIAEGKIAGTSMTIGGNLSEYTEFLREFGAVFMVPLASEEATDSAAEGIE